MKTELLQTLYEEEKFITDELEARTDPSMDVDPSKYNLYLLEQLLDINTTINEIITINDN